ncbi:SAM-dependent methyltransferase [Halorhabdus amylolytica]|uniref:hypothetical protein n=1 Tax=Halorhabdus amylolytica TaxID=2559573 RepID=UPI00145A955D|nr:hypothetical protein [Halorhabdus amylolytica]
MYDRLLRPHLPRKIGVFNGVAVRHPKLLDATDENWAHKPGMVEGIARVVDPCDTVVEIGSGMGVLTVRAARETTRHGRVYGFEAGKDRVSWARETVELNDVDEWTSVTHGLVEGGDMVWGKMGEPKRLSVEELPDHDVLITDCDGGERPILNGLTPDTVPDAVVIESHGMHGVPTEWVRDRLAALGFTVQNVRPTSTETSPDEDNMAVVATRERSERQQ